MAEKSFLQRVRDGLEGLHPAERRLANFLLNFPGELAAYTAQELANLANVSPPTVSRFIKRLGYANYDAARRHVRIDKKSGAALLMVESKSNVLNDEVKAHLQQAQLNLENTFLTTSLTEIDTLAESILSARKVWVLGFRSSHGLASYLYWQIYQVCPTISLCPAAGQTMAEHISAIAPEDCVVIIGMARRPKILEMILPHVINRGAKVAFVSDESMPDIKNIDWHFKCQTLAPGPLFSHASVMMLMQMIATRVIEVSGLEGRKHLSLVEDLHEKMDELWLNE